MNDADTGRRRVALLLAYDGTEFLGWQRQAVGRTVQEELERMLSRLAGERPVTVIGAGRTDSGVHASGQVAHADFPGAMSDASLHHALSRMCPSDLATINLATVPDEFHARYSARRRTYEYKIIRRSDPFLARYALHVGWDLHIENLRAAAGCFLGQHDFTALSKHNPDTPNPVCTVYHADWTELDGILRFVITADRFLYGMVRLLVGLQLDMARGRRGIDEVEGIFRSVDRSQQSPAVAPQGLTLTGVEYGEEFALPGHPVQL